VERFSEGAARLAGLAGALLGWRPDEFWQATPAELAAVLGALSGPGPGQPSMSRDDLERLMESYPDKAEEPPTRFG
jgi:uncharacterized phage protein (TIGR02216 family)